MIFIILELSREMNFGFNEDSIRVGVDMAKSCDISWIILIDSLFQYCCLDQNICKFLDIGQVFMKVPQNSSYLVS